MDHVVLVDEQDNKIGLMEKLEAHRGSGHLHRAVSVLLSRQMNGKNEVLLQQRSQGKPLWPMFWSNTVCTHPRDEERPVDCAVRRLSEEMGIVVKREDLLFIYPLLYQARYNDQYSEYELDHVFVGRWDGKPRINADEAKGYKWENWEAVKREIIGADFYTPWFKQLVQNKDVQREIEK